MKKRLIIADDHSVFIDGMKALLADVEWLQVVAEAHTGEELIALTEKTRPDLVLTDIQMPVMDGMIATREITRKFAGTKVVVLTMLDEGYYIRKMLEAGAAGYLLKTVNKHELIKALQVVSRGEKYFSHEIAGKLVNDFGDSITPKNKPLDTLTRREREVLVLIAQGLTDKEIADKVFLSPSTVITHRKNLLSKLGLKNKVELTRFALENNLLA